MAEFVRFEGKYKIFKSRTGEHIVKRAEETMLSLLQRVNILQLIGVKDMDKKEKRRA